MRKVANIVVIGKWSPKDIHALVSDASEHTMLDGKDTLQM